MTKIAIVLLCFSLCGAGTFVASITGKQNEWKKTNVMPVKNREVVQRILIWA
jgi:hypothetical protein